MPEKAKTMKIGVAFYPRIVYTFLNKYEQRRCVRKGCKVRRKAKQGNGVRANAQSPALTNTVCV